METELPDSPRDTSPPPPACVLPAPMPVPDCELLDRLLALARSFLAAGARRQAMDICWSLAGQYLHTIQGRAARDELVRLAAQFDAEGAHHTARDMIQQLLEIEREAGHGRG